MRSRHQMRRRAANVPDTSAARRSVTRLAAPALDVCARCPSRRGAIAGGYASCAESHEAAAFDASSQHHHERPEPGSRCVECHMPARDDRVVHARMDHSLRVPRPDPRAVLGALVAAHLQIGATAEALHYAERCSVLDPADPATREAVERPRARP